MRVQLISAVLAIVGLPAVAKTPVVGADFSKVPFQRGQVILFQGDSITDGGRQRTGRDLNHIMGQDYGYLIAAEIGYLRPELDLDFENRGVSGDKVRDLAARWKADALDMKPDVLSILVGVNDTVSTRGTPESLAEYEAIYDKLLADTVQALPHVRIVLGEPFLLPVGKYKEEYAARAAAVGERAAVVNRLAAKYHLPVVHYQAAFTQACSRAPAEHWSWDGVHPTYAGHALMAAEWMRVVSDAWGR